MNGKPDNGDQLSQKDETMTVKTYDQGCYDLALLFLQDSNLHADRISDLADSLALDIQQAIEDFLTEKNL